MGISSCFRSSSSATARVAPLTSFGSEPFTPFQSAPLRHVPAAGQRDKVAKNHSLTFGGTFEKFHSDNSFYFGIQSAYAYNTLADFYADANGFLANPNRTVSPVNLLGFQVKYLLQPGQTTPPLQPLDVIYAGGYIQDEWRPRSNLTVTSGIRIDVPKFGNTAFDNPVADNLTFRDQDGSPVKLQHRRAAAGDAVLLAARRHQLGCQRRPVDPDPRRIGPVLGQTAVRLDLEPDRQHRRALWIHRQRGTRPRIRSIPARTDAKPAATASTAASYRPRRDRSGLPLPANLAQQHRCGSPPSLGSRRLARLHLQPRHQCAGLLNADLPALRASRASTIALAGRHRGRRGVGARHHRRVSAVCDNLGLENGPCAVTHQQRPRQPRHRQLRHQEPEPEPLAEHLRLGHQDYTLGFSLTGGFNYGVSRSLVEPSSTAGTSWGGTFPGIVADPNNPALAYSANSPGKRVFFTASTGEQVLRPRRDHVLDLLRRPYQRQHQLRLRGRRERRTASANDLIYIPQGSPRR